MDSGQIRTQILGLIELQKNIPDQTVGVYFENAEGLRVGQREAIERRKNMTINDLLLAAVRGEDRLLHEDACHLSEIDLQPVNYINPLWELYGAVVEALPNETALELH